VVAVFPLAALQPGQRRGSRSIGRDQRDFEYLSGFAATPFHLINYVAPGCPSLRAVATSRLGPAHAMPEKSDLHWAGPAVLAGMAMVRAFRRDAAVRLLTIVAVVTLILSFGSLRLRIPILDRVARLSFFRAPRWSLRTA